MVNGLTVTAIIPARGGSKSIPRKNIKPLGGFPLISYSIAAALTSRYVDRVIVSTEDAEIAECAKRWGATVPFLRPAHLAEDATPDLPVFIHCLDWLLEHDGAEPDLLVQLRPTSPFRPPDSLDRALESIAAQPEADSLRAVTLASQTPYKMWRIKGQRLRPLLSHPAAEPYNMPRQQLPKVYWQTGQLDIIRSRTIRLKASLTGSQIIPFVMPPEYAVDLDNLIQWQYAEYLLASGRLNIVSPGDWMAEWLRPIRLVGLDFDGVMTDDLVYQSQSGEESVVCSRADGYGIRLLRQAGLPAIVLSTEENPVVQQRCKKLKIPCLQGIDDKASAIKELCEKYQVNEKEIAYIGNDLNDLSVMKRVGLPVAVANAHPRIKEIAKMVLMRDGGRGAVREFIELLLKAQERSM